MKIIKIISLLLVFLFVFSSLVACVDEPDETDKSSDSETDELPETTDKEDVDKLMEYERSKIAGELIDGLYKYPDGDLSTWYTAENPNGRKGMAAQSNGGYKGSPAAWLAPGGELSLMEGGGSGVIRQMWLTYAGVKDEDIVGKIRIKIYWDREKTPAVDVPFESFFCHVPESAITPFENKYFLSPEGRSFNCLIPMYFKRGAKIVLVNESDVGTNVYYCVEANYKVDVPDVPHYLHVVNINKGQTVLGEEYELASITGRGYFVGANVIVRDSAADSDKWAGKGKFTTYLDGEATVSSEGENIFDTWQNEAYSGVYEGSTVYKKRFKSGFVSGFYKMSEIGTEPFGESLRLTFTEEGASEDTVEGVVYFMLDTPVMEGKTGDVPAKKVAVRDAVSNEGHESLSVKIAAGSEITLFELNGAGIIEKLYITYDDFKSEPLFRKLMIKMYWDGSDTPAVYAPLEDFFCDSVKPEIRSYETALFSCPDGQSYLSFAPMPFKSAARIVIENTADVEATVSSRISVDRETELPAEFLYFHAIYQPERKTVIKEDFEVLPKVTGVGRFIGTNITVRDGEGLYGAWFGEGETKYYVDGDTDYPTLTSTGTEDFILSAWSQGEFDATYSGCSLYEFADNGRMSTTFYRLHVPDEVYFYEDLRVTIQQMGSGNGKQVLGMIANGATVYPVWAQGEGDSQTEAFGYTEPELRNMELDYNKVTYMNFMREDYLSCVSYLYLNRAGK